MRCKFGDNSAEFRTISTIGEAYDVCPIAGDGKDLEIGFNCKYLLDALRAVPDSECTLEMINGLSPPKETATAIWCCPSGSKQENKP